MDAAAFMAENGGEYMTEVVVFQQSDHAEPLRFIGMSEERAYLVSCWTCGNEQEQSLMSYCPLDKVFYCTNHWPYFYM